MDRTKMQLTSDTETDFWSSSCSLKELSAAIENGAVGATTTPMVIGQVLKNEHSLWQGAMDQLIQDNPHESEIEITWKLIEKMGIKAAKLLESVFEREQGQKGRLMLQVNPIHYNNKQKMVEQGRYLASLAPNMAIGIPVIEEGLKAIEELSSYGVVITGISCFSLAQAVACAEAIERGLKKAKDYGIPTDNLRPLVTLMLGRLDDQLRREMAHEHICIDPGYIEWAGIAVFKKAYQIFKQRGYQSSLAAVAIRNHMHWSEFIGGDVAVSLPYKWWNLFNESDIEVVPRIHHPVNEKIVDDLYDFFDDFRRAYDEDGMRPKEFFRFGATLHTFQQFTTSYRDLLGSIGHRMLLVAR